MDGVNKFPCNRLNINAHTATHADSLEAAVAVVVGNCK